MMKNGKRYLLVAIALLLATVMFSGLAMADGDEEKAITKITFTPDTIEEKLEYDPELFVAIPAMTVEPAGYTDWIKYTSNDPDTADLSYEFNYEYGFWQYGVKSKKPGTVTITATAMKQDNTPSGATGTFKVTFTEIPATKVILTKYSDKVELYTGDEYTSGNLDDEYLESFVPANCTYQEVKWSSSNPEIVRVDKDGNFEARKVGTATLTATVQDSKKVTQKLEMEVVNPKPITKVSFTPDTFELKANEYFDPEDYLTVEPEGMVLDDAKVVKWYSSDPDIFDVNYEKAGRKLGTATITCEVTNYDGSVVTGSLTVKVVPKPVTGLAFTKSSIQRNQKETAQIDLWDYLKISPADADYNTTDIIRQYYSDDLLWESSNEEVAKVSNGYVTILGEAGSATITVSLITDPSISASIVISTEKALINAVKFDRKTATLYYVKKEGKLWDDRNVVNVGIVIEPSNAYVKTISAETSNAKVAIPDPDGYLKKGEKDLSILAVGKGKCVITLYVSDGKNNFTASLKVTVTDKGPQAKLNKKNLTLEVGKKATLVAKDSSKTKLAGKWSSSDKTIAKVNKKGVVKGVKPGRCVITFTPKSKTIKPVSCQVKVVKPSLK